MTVILILFVTLMHRRRGVYVSFTENTSIILKFCDVIS
jgi:hypothetical protein